MSDRELEIDDEGDLVADPYLVARDIWAFQAGQNAAETARKLSDLGLYMHERTVRRWAAKDDWSSWARERIRELAPGVSELAVVELIFGSFEAAKVLRQIVNNDGVYRDEDGNVFPIVDAKTRAMAARDLLNFAGYSPVGRNDKTAERARGDRRGLNMWFPESEVGDMIREIKERIGIE
jgi:hypothetical protein